MEKLKRVLIASGASGGHFFSSLSFARFLKERGLRIFFVVNKEEFIEILKKEGFESFLIRFRSFSYSPWKLVKSLCFLIKSIFEGFFIVWNLKPEITLGFGSFASLGVCVWARLLGSRLIIHEQNVLYGKANMLLGFFACGIGIQRWTRPFYPHKEFFCPLSIREEFKDYKLSPWEAKRKLGLDGSRITLLFMGGSQGSRFINHLAIKLLKVFENKDLQFIIISGKKDYSWIKKFARERVVVYSFCSSIWQIFRASDIGVFRAGILSLYEALYEKVYPLMIPYPYSFRHQRENALFFSRESLGRILDEEEAEEKAEEMIKKVLEDKATLEEFHKRIPDFISLDGPRILYERIRKILS